MITYKGKKEIIIIIIICLVWNLALWARALHPFD
jgi:hypothetical protein